MPPRPSTVFAGLTTTIFESMSRLAETHRALNLGQGFPDEGGPAAVVEEARRFLLEGNNQYPPMAGLLVLREAITRHEARHYDVTLDPKSQVIVTSGATEALTAAILAFVSPGDEVVVFEPLYDSYVPIIRRAGGTPIPVRLSAPEWRLDHEVLARAVSDKTRMILVNNPQNPAGKVFSRIELEAIAAVARAKDAIVLADEVYEHLVFDGATHVSLSSVCPERTLKVGSAGKVFSMTGWKVGWLTGPADLVTIVARTHQYLTFTTPPNLQSAVALGLDQEGDWIDTLTRELQEKRDHFARGLRALGMHVVPSAGTYFLCVDLSGTPWEGRDEAFCHDLIERRGVAAIPLGAFYVDAPSRNVARFCFAKKREMLDAALDRLAKST